MANVAWKVVGTSGNWSLGPWTGLPADEFYPGQTGGDNDAVTLGGASVSYTVTDDVATLAIGSLIFTATSKVATTTLLMVGSDLLTVANTASLVSGATIDGTGTLSVGGKVQGNGTIRAGTGTSGGTLVLAGTGSLVTGSSGPVFSIGTSFPSTLEFDFSGPVAASPISINNVNQTLEVAAGTLTLNGAQNVANGTLQIAGGTVADSSGVSLGSGSSSGNLQGFGTVTANLSRSGSGTADIVTAVGGLLDLKGQVASELVLAIDFTAPADLKIDKTATATSPVAISSANQKLEVGSTGSLTIQTAETINAGTVQLDGGTLTDSTGFTLGNGAALFGSGTVNGNLASGSGSAGTITALGGLLDLKDQVTSGLILAIDSTAPADLKLDKTASAVSPIGIGTTSQTLEVGSAGALTIQSAEVVNSGTVKLDGGALTDTAGITVGSGATLIGFGKVTGVIAGSGAVRADGGVLNLLSNITSTGTTFQIDPVSGSVLKLSGAATTGGTFTFAGSAGVLELADEIQFIPQFNGTVAGLNVGASATVPTNKINLQSAATKAVLSGNTITVSNAGKLIATLVLSATPAAGAYALVAADSALGGKDVFLSNAPPVVTVSGTAQEGQTLTAHASTPDPNATLSYQWQSSSSGGTTWSNLSGAIASTYLVAATDETHILRVVVTASDGDGTNSAPTAAVTDLPPTVTWSPSAETGVEGAAIALGAIVPTSVNPLASIAVSGISAGSTLSDGTNTFVASPGTTAVNVVGWNYGNLSLTPADDVNLSLSVQATNLFGGSSNVATEAVTIDPLAPTVAPAPVSGVTGQPIALNLGIAVNGLSGDQNSLSSVVISGVPTGATLSNSNGNALTITGGSITFSASQLAAGVLHGLAITPTSTGDFPLNVAATEQDSETNLSATATGTELVDVAAAGPPAYSHIVVVMEENQGYSDIIGNTIDAPYINDTLAADGAVLADDFALGHPSSPNYIALYSGNSFGITDDNLHSLPDPTLATILQGAGDSFTGYVETPDSSTEHEPWLDFPEGASVETDFSLNSFNSLFPSGNFSSLPTVSFVIPNVNNDMHDGSVAEGDAWLQANINAYAQWATANNSLLIVTWDENDGSGENQIPADPVTAPMSLLAHIRPTTMTTIS